MARCAICDKGAHFGNNVSHSHRRSNKMWKSNIKSVRVKVNGGTKKMYVCTSCLRSDKVVPALFSFAQILIPVRAFQSIISDLIQQKSGETFLGSLPLFFLAVGCFFGTVLLQSSFYCSGNMFRFFIFLQLLSLADLLFSAFSYTWKASWPVRSLLLLHRSC